MDHSSSNLELKPWSQKLSWIFLLTISFFICQTKSIIFRFANVHIFTSNDKMSLHGIEALMLHYLTNILKILNLWRKIPDFFVAPLGFYLPCYQPNSLTLNQYDPCPESFCALHTALSVLKQLICGAFCSIYRVFFILECETVYKRHAQESVRSCQQKANVTALL